MIARCFGGKGTSGPFPKCWQFVDNMPAVSAISLPCLHVANHVYKLKTAFLCAWVNDPP